MARQFDPEVLRLAELIVAEAGWGNEPIRGVNHRALTNALNKLKPRTCGAKTRRGTRCIARALPGRKRCRNHGGLSTGPRTDEGKAIVAAARRAAFAAKVAREAVASASNTISLKESADEFMRRKLAAGPPPPDEINET